ncbi:YetF domain-containing protein [Acrocarpospora corrugata]|uniref:YetF domain-containing protein n=1 Tax=Acrocarpospora corrugata TaxID=35763 RepID=UPI0012D347D0
MFFQGWSDVGRLRDGEFQPELMRAQRVTAGEVCQAVRAQGLGDLGAVTAVVLETDGSFSVVSAGHAGRRSALPGPHVGGGPSTRAGG